MGVQQYLLGGMQKRRSDFKKNFGLSLSQERMSPLAQRVMCAMEMKGFLRIF
jgi:hypothetical protein